eukprot:3707674-Pyramimonas_sp.AAC.1
MEAFYLGEFWLPASICIIVLVFPRRTGTSCVTEGPSLKRLECLFVLMGEFNLEPDALDYSGWVSALGADIVAAEGRGAPSCRSSF